MYNLNKLASKNELFKTWTLLKIIDVQVCTLTISNFNFLNID